MKVQDYVINRKGMKITVGSRVRYIGTGTVGVVKAINLAYEKYWALLDSTNLYYDVDYLEPLSEVSGKREANLGAGVKEVDSVIKKEDRVIEKATEVTPSGAG
ncbi:MAG: DUF2098 domain-containing protein [Candidatus Nezhaarchaeota archaeon]|nr:DUF2098 domain-containing protein [Candidatus Nezhaarchaeota archaeon]